VSVTHRLFLLSFQCASVWKRLGSHAFIRRGIYRVHFIPRDRFALGGLAGNQQVTQLFNLDFAFQQRIVDTAELTAKQRRLADRNRRTDLTGYRQGVDHVHNCIGSIAHLLVYCIAELVERVFGHAITLSASSTSC